jgi:outer membrane protein assembly factor BamB
MVVASLGAIGQASAEDWVRFRGPNGQGISSESQLPLHWTTTEHVAWRTPIPGEAWSSPIVYQNDIYLTTATDGGAVCRVLCVDRNTGDIRWNTEVHRQVVGAKRQQNSYATPTPLTDGQQVYAVFSDGCVVALDLAGNLVWKNAELKFYSLHGLGASPVLIDDVVVMPFDGSSPSDERVGWKIPWQEAKIIAFDTRTGERRWTGTRGESRVGHVTPILLESGEQFVSAGGDRVQGFESRTGKQIWSIYSQGEGVTPSPIMAGELIITSSGFEEPTIRAIRMGGTGEITNTHIAWEQKRGVPVLASPLYVAPYIYTISRDNILQCLEAATGEIVWTERLSGVHSASPVFADGRIYILSEEGVTLVLRPGPVYEELARNSIGEVCKASMAVSQGHFFIRSAQHLYCIEP